ncbi:MAG: aminopeptidase, partial [Deltaproteobacteria bacterium]|nr:aminopeptidase [Deltaproteobacteria bacterium]
DSIKNIFAVNLGVKKSEKVIVFTDIIHEGEKVSREERIKRKELREIAGKAALAGKDFASIEYLEFPSVMGHGKEPPIEAWRACFGDKAVGAMEKARLLDKLLAKDASPHEIKAAEEIISKEGKTPDAVIALSNFSTSHTRFRDFLTRLKRVRYASMPLFEKNMLDSVMTADWEAVKKRTMNVVAKMSGCDMVYITSHNGTSVSFSIKDRPITADTGIITEPGSFGNLPAGEAFLAPVEGTAEGILVLEWGPDGKLRSSIELEIKKGMVAAVDGRGKVADELRGKIEENPLIGNIAELGIGTNDKAIRPDNILETEKILGTVHIALGDNSSFGGKVSVPFHQDFVFFRPTLEALRREEKIEILVEGEPRF